LTPGQYLFIPLQLDIISDTSIFLTLSLFKGGEMEHISLSFVTWFWLLVPMPLAVLLSFLNLLLAKKEGNR